MTSARATQRLAPFRTAPIHKTKPRWGDGRRLARLGLAIPADLQPVGESWLVTDVEGEPASPIRDGPHAGRSLRELLASDREGLLGPALAARGGGFPLLVKLLDLGDWLSIQVHPDGETARALHQGQRGKHEAWLVLAAGERAEVALGLDPAAVRARGLTPGELVGLGAELLPLMRRHRDLVPGDGIEVTPGTVHTGRDLLVLEVQETCDLTYRIYDWGRDAAARPLHLAEAATCLERTGGHLRAGPGVARAAEAPDATRRELVGPSAPFVFAALTVSPGAALELEDEGCRIAVATAGGATLETATGRLELVPGEAAVVPHAAGARLRIVAGASGARLGYARPRA